MKKSHEEMLLYLTQSKMFKEIIGDTPSKITELPLNVENNSISGQVSFHQQSVFKLALEFETKDDMICVLKMKSKKIIQHGIELINYDQSPEFQKILDGPHNIIGYDNSHIRESCFYDNISKSFRETLPRVYGSFYDPKYDIYVILMDFHKSCCAFDEKVITKSLDAITNYHSHYYNHHESVKQLMLNYYTTDDYREQKNILLGMFKKLNDSNKAIFSERHNELLLDFAKHIDEYHAKLPLHRSVTHNDFTPRNIFCTEEGVVIFDWELACYQCPEHDLIEFLVFIMFNMEDEQVLSIIEMFRQMLFKKCNVSFDNDTYKSILVFNLLEYCVNRLSLYRVCNKLLKIDFVDVLTANAERLLTIMNV